jgi:hypothetical protein
MLKAEKRIDRPPDFGIQLRIKSAPDVGQLMLQRERINVLLLYF